MPLIGREDEQRALGAAWQHAVERDPQLAVVWGRRRVGKTYLLADFADNRRAVYFTATRQDNEARQLERFTQRLHEQLGSQVTELMTGRSRTGRLPCGSSLD